MSLPRADIACKRGEEKTDARLSLGEKTFSGRGAHTCTAHNGDRSLAHTYLLLFTLIAHIRTNKSVKRRVCRVRAPYANSPRAKRRDELYDRSERAAAKSMLFTERKRGAAHRELCIPDCELMLIGKILRSEQGRKKHQRSASKGGCRSYIFVYFNYLPAESMEALRAIRFFALI